MTDFSNQGPAGCVGDMSGRRKCSGSRCQMQRGAVDPGQRNCAENCPDFTPAADFSKMEACCYLAPRVIAK